MSTENPENPQTQEPAPEPTPKPEQQEPSPEPRPEPIEHPHIITETYVPKREETGNQSRIQRNKASENKQR